jgi:hypothetical protein
MDPPQPSQNALKNNKSLTYCANRRIVPGGSGEIYLLKIKKGPVPYKFANFLKCFRNYV